MFPARDIGGSVGSVAIANGKVNDLAVKFCRAEDQVEIPEGIEVAKVGAIGGDLFIIFTPHYFGAAQGVFDGLSQYP